LDSFTVARSQAPAAIAPARALGIDDAFVGGDRDLDPPAQRGELRQRRAWLLRELQVTLGVHGVQLLDGVVWSPGAVGIDSQHRVAAYGAAHQHDLVDVAWKTDLELEGPKP